MSLTMMSQHIPRSWAVHTVHMPSDQPAGFLSAERGCNHKLIAENETLYENVFYEHGNPIVPSGFNHMFNVNDPAPESGIANTSKWY